MANNPNALGRRSQDESIRTQQRILHEAEILFSKLGYGGVSVREIAKAAGVHHGTVQHHFGSKHDVYDAVVHRYDQEIESLILNTIGKETDLVKAVELALDVLFDFLVVKRNWVILSTRVAIADDQPESGGYSGQSWIQFIEKTLKSKNLGELDVDIGMLMVSVEAVLNYHILADNHYNALYGETVTVPKIQQKTKVHLKKMIIAMVMGVFQEQTPVISNQPIKT